MEKFKYDRIAPSIREIRSRRALSIIDKAMIPVRPVVAQDPRFRQNRLVSARNDLRIQKSKSFLDSLDSKENFGIPKEKAENQIFSFCAEVESSETLWAPKVLPLYPNKFASDLEKMEARLSSFYNYS